MRSLRLLPVLLLAACWKLDAPALEVDRFAFTPAVGAPDGWWVESFDMQLTCPDGEPARFWIVYPDYADYRAHGDGVPALPLAVVYPSGAFDWELSPDADAPLAGETFEESLQRPRRLGLDWAADRVFATLGLVPNRDPWELHAGALPAALATKGITMLIPGNCWGDFWHNRSGSSAENVFVADRFFRDGRTAAEFAWLHATQPFPPGNPVELPIVVDTDRIYAVGLGAEGSRAVGELLNVTNGTLQAYPVTAAFVDSPVDDLSVFYGSGVAPELEVVQDGLSRIFPGTAELGTGTIFSIPGRFLPERFGIAYSTNDARIPQGANNRLLGRYKDDLTPDIVWVYESDAPAHVLSNADVHLARAVADFLVDGEDAIDPEDL